MSARQSQGAGGVSGSRGTTGQTAQFKEASDHRKGQPLLLDEFGNDVAPLPLMPSGHTGPTVQIDFRVADSNRHEAGADDALSVSGMSVSALSVTSGDSHPGSQGSVDEATAGAGASAQYVYGDYTRTEVNPNEEVVIELSETETIGLLHQPSVRVREATPEEGLVLERNAIYQELREATALGGDTYTTRHTQTLDAGRSHKKLQTEPPGTCEVAVQAAAWDIADAAAAAEEEEEEDDDRHLGATTASKGTVPGNDAVSTAGSNSRPGSAAPTQQGSGAGSGSAAGGGSGESGSDGAVTQMVDAILALPGVKVDAESAVVIAPPLPAAARAKASASGRAGGQAADRTSRTGLSSAVGVSVADALRASSRAGGGSGGGGGGGGSGQSAPWAGAMPGQSALNMTGSMFQTSLGETVTSSSLDESQDPAARAAQRPWEQAAGSGLGPLLIAQQRRVLGSPELLRSARAVERVLQQQVYHKAHRLFRAASGTPALEALLVAELEEERKAAARLRVEAAAAGGGAGASGATEAAGGFGDHGEEDEEDEEDDGDGDEDDAVLGGGGGGGAAGAGAAADTAEAAAKPSKPARKGVGFVDSGAEEEDDEADAAAGSTRVTSLHKLWTYHMPALEGLAVTSMAANAVADDLIAAGYGLPRYAARGRGVIALWSMRNPTHPEVLLNLDSGVASLAFSTQHPATLAAGLQDGTVALLDTRRLLNREGALAPDVRSDGLRAGSHTEPVWQVEWVDRGDGRGERLLSIGADGRVNQWSTSKGTIECTTIMMLRRVAPADEVTGPPPNRPARERQSASTTGAGLCFAFNTEDPTMYFAGTDDGNLHRCNVTYAEQELDLVPAHFGPLNRVRLSELEPWLGLTASADWTIKLWNLTQGEQMQLFVTDDARAAVTDVRWCPLCPHNFISVTGDGRIQVWELGELKPILETRVVDKVPAPDAAASGAAEAKEQDDGSSDEELDFDGKEEEEEEAEAAVQAAAAAEVPMVDAPRPFTTVLLASRAPVVLTGDERGRIDVYRLLGAPAPSSTREEALEAMRRRLQGAEEEEEEEAAAEEERPASH